MADDLLIELAKYCKKIHERKLASGISGNISIRDKDRIIITPGGYGLSEVEPEDLVIIDINGNSSIEQNKPSRETLMHILIYKSRPHINCVIHTHSPVSTTFAYLNKPILPISPESSIYIPKLPIVHFNRLDKQTIAETIANSLKDCNAVLLEKHGVVTVGSSISQAYNLLEVVEETALMNIYMGAIKNL